MAITLYDPRTGGDGKLDWIRHRFVKSAGTDYLLSKNDRRQSIFWSFQNSNAGGQLQLGLGGVFAMSFTLRPVTATRATDHKLITIDDDPALTEYDIAISTTFIAGIIITEVLCPCGQVAQASR